jgi:CRISPR system Cascade subunit CasE
MYFSRITLNPSQIQKFLKTEIYGGLYDEHRLIWRFFPENEEQQRDFLYRKNDDSKTMQFFLLSERKPENDLDAFLIETKPFAPVIRKGAVYQFQLRANPVVTRMPEGKESKKRRRDDVFLDTLAKNQTLPPAEQRTSQEVLTHSGSQWLIGRSEALGFSVNHVLVERYRRLQTRKKDTKMTFGVMDFAGQLTVTDEEPFRSSLLKGIGHGKAFGCGLLLIRRAL